MWFFNKQPSMPDPAEALPGRADPISNPPPHHVNGRSLVPPYPDGFEVADLALGCFWGPEKDFWKMPGVWTTAVGYAGGFTPNPTYQEACSGRTGHAETVRVVFDPAQVELRADPQGVLGVPRPDPGDAPGQRHRQPVPIDRSSPTRMRSSPSRWRRATCTRSS